MIRAVTRVIAGAVRPKMLNRRELLVTEGTKAVVRGSVGTVAAVSAAFPGIRAEASKAVDKFQKVADTIGEKVDQTVNRRDALGQFSRILQAALGLAS